jgi:hypothetical protein
MSVIHQDKDPEKGQVDMAKDMEDLSKALKAISPELGEPAPTNPDRLNTMGSQGLPQYVMVPVCATSAGIEYNLWNRRATQPNTPTPVGDGHREAVAQRVHKVVLVYVLLMFGLAIESLTLSLFPGGMPWFMDILFFGVTLGLAFVPLRYDVTVYRVAFLGRARPRPIGLVHSIADLAEVRNTYAVYKVYKWGLFFGWKSECDAEVTIVVDYRGTFYDVGSVVLSEETPTPFS